MPKTIQFASDPRADVADLLDRIRTALCDPDAPWYGSDLVPLVGDLCDEFERTKEPPPDEGDDGVTLEWLATIGLGPPQVVFWDGGFSVHFVKQRKWLNFDARTTRPDFLRVMRILGETIKHEASL